MASKSYAINCWGWYVQIFNKRHVQNSSLTPIDFQLSSFPSSSVLMSGVHFGCTAISHVERLEAISVLNKTEPYIALFTQSVSVRLTQFAAASLLHFYWPVGMLVLAHIINWSLTHLPWAWLNGCINDIERWSSDWPSTVLFDEGWCNMSFMRNRFWARKLSIRSIPPMNLLYVLIMAGLSTCLLDEESHRRTLSTGSTPTYNACCDVSLDPNVTPV